MATTTSTTTPEIPDWAKPYVLGPQEGGASVKDASGTPYQGILNQAIGLASAETPQYGPAAAYTDEEGTYHPAQTTQEWVNQNIGSTAGRVAGFNPLQNTAFENIGKMQPSEYLDRGAGLAGLAGTRTYDAGTAQQYMNPYMQQVVDQQKQAAIQDYSRAMPGLQSQAYRQGAGRGTRSALVQSEANRNLQNNLQNIQAQGLQNAWQQGQGQFNTEAGRQLQAGLGLGQIGQNAYLQNLGINQAQQAAGLTGQNLQQNQFNTAYETWLAQQRDPYQRLGFASDILNGMPANAYTSNMYTPSARPNVGAQTAGLIGAGLGYLGGMNSSTGG